MDDYKDIIVALKCFEQDNDVPKNVRTKLNETITSLEVQCSKVHLNKTLHLLEGISEDTNLSAMTRTSLISVLSLIESRVR